MRRCDATDRQHDASMTKCNQPAETTPSQAPTADADPDADAAAAAVAAVGEGGGEARGGQKSLEDDEVRLATSGQCVHALKGCPDRVPASQGHTYGSHGPY